MKKAFFLLSTLTAFVLLLNSCKQCNKPANDNITVQADTSANPALNAINAQIAKDSTNPFLYYKRAQVYDVMQNYKDAVGSMVLALSLDSVRPEFYLYAAELLGKLPEPQRGIALMNRAISIDSNNVDFYVEAAKLAYIDTTISGNYNLAINYLNTAIDKDPQNANIYFNKGMIYKEVGDTAKAISSFQTATELNPKYYDAYVQIGLILRTQKDKNAEKYLDNAIKVSDKPEDALYAKANILKEEGTELYDGNQPAKAKERMNSAIENFKKVIELNHRNTEAYMGIAFSYYQMDSLQQAYKYYGLAAEVSPTYAGAYFSKGLCAEEMGKKAEAIALYENCLNIDPTFKRAEEHLKNLKPAN